MLFEYYSSMAYAVTITIATLCQWYIKLSPRENVYTILLSCGTFIDVSIRIHSKIVMSPITITRTISHRRMLSLWSANGYLRDDSVVLWT